MRENCITRPNPALTALRILKVYLVLFCFLQTFLINKTVKNLLNTEDDLDAVHSIHVANSKIG